MTNVANTAPRPLYFEQEGGYFFFRLRPFYNLEGEFDEEHPNYNQGCCLSDAYTVAPMRVFFDGPSAEQASAWFEAQARAAGFEPIRDDYDNRVELPCHEIEYARLSDMPSDEPATTVAAFARSKGLTVPVPASYRVVYINDQDGVQDIAEIDVPLSGSFRDVYKLFRSVLKANTHNDVTHVECFGVVTGKCALPVADLQRYMRSLLATYIVRRRDENGNSYRTARGYWSSDKSDAALFTHQEANRVYEDAKNCDSLHDMLAGVFIENA